MGNISANSLKTQGAKAITRALAKSPEATVSVRGKDRFVVMDIKHYQYLRECERTAALAGPCLTVVITTRFSDSVQLRAVRRSRQIAFGQNLPGGAFTHVAGSTRTPRP